MKGHRRSGNEVVRAYDAMLADRTQCEGLWNFVRKFVLRSRAEVAADDIRDSTAVSACQGLAGIEAEYMTPASSIWFSFDPPHGLAKVSGVKEWYAECGTIAADVLTGSNFYAAMGEMYLDRAGFGCGALLCFRHGDDLNFEHVPIGSFVWGEDAKGGINCMIRELSLTSAQAVEQFGEAGLSDKVMTAYNDPQKRYVEKFLFLHEMYVEAGVWYNTYVLRDSKSVVFGEVLSEQPYFGTRFLRGANAYGYPPVESCRAEVIRLQDMNKQLDKMAAVAADPRVLAHASLIGAIDLRPGGVTVLSDAAIGSSLPREWATGGKFEQGVAIIERSEKVVRDAFYGGVVDAFAGVDRQMTATEVEARLLNKVMTFSPSFVLFVHDLAPLMKRIFMELYRMGKFPKAPAACVRVLDNGDAVIADPKVGYKNRMSLMLAQGEGDAVLWLANTLLSMGNMGAELIKVLKLDEAVRRLALSRGVPVDVLHTDKEMDMMHAADAERASKAEAMGDVEALAGAAGKLGFNKAI